MGSDEENLEESTHFSPRTLPIAQNRFPLWDEETAMRKWDARFQYKKVETRGTMLSSFIAFTNKHELNEALRLLTNRDPRLS